MESNVTPIEAKEQLKSKKFGQLMRIEITNEIKKHLTIKILIYFLNYHLTISIMLFGYLMKHQK